MSTSGDPHKDLGLGLEHLEQRKLLSANLDGGSLELRGTDGDDAIIVDATDVDGQVRVSGVEGVEDGTIFEGVRRVRVRLGQGDDSAEVSGEFFNDRGRLTRFRIEGGRGDDVITGGDSRNRLLGGAGDDILTGGDRADILRGRKGDDILNGGGGADKLRGDDGVDTLHGGEGNDELKGGRGDDELHGDDGHDRVSGGAGDDLIHGGRGNDDLNGNSGSDELYGEDGDDDFRGRDDEARDHNADEDSRDDDSRDDSNDDGTDDQGGGNDDDSQDGSDDDGTDDRGGGNDDDSGEHVGLDDDFISLLGQLELGLGELPEEFVALMTAAEDLNAVAGPAMHEANRVIKSAFTNDQIEELIRDDPAEGAGDAIMDAFELVLGGDDGVRDFDGDGAFLDFGDIISAYDVILSEMPDGSGGSVLDALSVLSSNLELIDAVENAFTNLIEAELGDAFWSIVGSSIG